MISEGARNANVEHEATLGGMEDVIHSDYPGGANAED